MRRRRLLTRQAVALSGVLLTAASCSFLYDLDQVQCEVKEDCAGFVDNPGVREVSCLEGVCTFVDLGAGGTGNTTAPNTTSPSTTSPTSTTGTAGSGGEPECTENDDCIAELGNPAICRNEECVDLFSDECPLVLGAGDNYEYLKSPNAPLIFGAYSFMGEVVPEDTYIAANYEFALDEVNSKTGGGYRVAGIRRPFVTVVCDMRGDIPASMQHLVKTLDVPALVSTLDTKQLLDIFENPDYGAKANDVFVISAFDADSTLTSPSVDPDGLMWHMLGEAADLGYGYKPLVARTEKYIRTQQEIPDEEPIRVVMVVADTPYLQDIASVIIDTVEFNGKSMLDNEADGNLKRYTIDSINEHNPPDLGTAPNAVQTYQPHIVLGITSGELLTHLMPGWEGYWDGNLTTPPPFYLLASKIGRAAVADEAEVRETGNNPEFIPLRQRVLGVVTAGAEDTTLYAKYLSNIKAKYENLVRDGIILDGRENYYDAIYYTMYAMHGGIATTNLTGRNVAQGMTRLLGGDLSLNVGQDDVVRIIDFLRTSDNSLTVNGTMGPPNFNGSGARSTLPSVYCVDFDPEGTGNTMTHFPDVLRYNPEDESLNGEDPCSIDGFMAEDP